MFRDIFEESLKDQNCFLVRSEEFPRVSFCYFGGSPPNIYRSEEQNVIQLRSEILSSIGYGSILTFGNPNKKNLQDFSDMAIESDELWAAKTYYVTMLFYDVPRTFREAVAYDRRFHMSWSERDLDFFYFTAQSSVYSWRKFLTHKDDCGFKREHREILTEAWNMWNKILPSLFKGSCDEKSDLQELSQGLKLASERYKKVLESPAGVSRQVEALSILEEIYALFGKTLSTDGSTEGELISVRLELLLSQHKSATLSE